MNPKNYLPVCSSEEINDRIDQMAKEIIAKYPDQKPLFVALLRGGLPFASKLMFAIGRHDPSYHPELDFMTIRTYGDERQAAQSEIVTDLVSKTDLNGRTIIVLDDVIDRGITWDFVSKLMHERGAKTVELAVLASKDIAERSSQADYVGFHTADKWLTGMGLDDTQVAPEAHRWLEGIWEFKQ